MNIIVVYVNHICDFDRPSSNTQYMRPYPTNFIKLTCELCALRKNWEFSMNNHFAYGIRFHTLWSTLTWSILITTSYQWVWRMANNIAMCFLNTDVFCTLRPIKLISWSDEHRKKYHFFLSILSHNREQSCSCFKNYGVKIWDVNKYRGQLTAYRDFEDQHRRRIGRT